MKKTIIFMLSAVLLSLSIIALAASMVTLRGTVYYGDLEQEEVIGATVRVIGNPHDYAVTDWDGNFQLDVSINNGDIIHISVLGYEARVEYRGNPNLGDIYLYPVE